MCWERLMLGSHAGQVYTVCKLKRLQFKIQGLTVQYLDYIQDMSINISFKLIITQKEVAFDHNLTN